MIEQYVKQVKLLVNMLPYIAKENCFALKGIIYCKKSTRVKTGKQKEHNFQKTIFFYIFIY